MVRRGRTPTEWIDRALEAVVGTTGNQESFAPVLNPLADTTTGRAHPVQFTCRELADHMFGTGHVSYNGPPWADKHEVVHWFSRAEQPKTLDVAFTEYSLWEVVEPIEAVGSDNVVGHASST